MTEEREVTQNQRIEFDEGDSHFTILRQRKVGGRTRRSTWFHWTPIKIIPGVVTMNEQEREEKDNEIERGGVRIWRACIWVMALFLVGFCAWWSYSVLYSMGYRVAW